ncbi:MAG: PQQ-dependent dehydrogenase, methanol/ethanol family, partial [Alphaproteobacteria bacterium]|nr:PQQ-dependent dehydrogenase, methanol/ethanol family [Alphaproteobacteria bacterium]
MTRIIALMPVAALLLSSCGGEPEQTRATVAVTASPAAAIGVTESRLANAANDTSSWLSHGRTYSEQRFVPLDNINSQNVDQLGLAWYFDLSTRRGVEATPLIVDGIMYVTGAWSVVYAVDARSGEQVWVYDPQVPLQYGRYACCDVVNRGVAAWGDKIYVGTLDGYLVALNARDGGVAWRVNTIDRGQPYTITGAPRVIKGKVIIGNGGAEYGVRGFITAYDAESGEQAWRFHTVPGNPADGFESPAMEQAAATWTGEWWTMGGGGTVWDAMAYDAELDLLYIGVGNGSPWNRDIRSPAGGDNLFLASIVALRPGTGEYVWHYQTTPGETWDFTATQHIILADLEIAGESRQVLMQAPKNGFFYVIDRRDGKLISAEPYIPVTWATGVDPATGRPMETPNARYGDGPQLLLPGPLGGHNWHPMSFNPNTGLVYFSAQELPLLYKADDNFGFLPGVWNTGVDWAAADFPTDPAEIAALFALVRGHLVAWDPVNQREAWRFQQAGPWNGGTLSTAGNL